MPTTSKAVSCQSRFSSIVGPSLVESFISVACLQFATLLVVSLQLNELTLLSNGELSTTCVENPSPGGNVLPRVAHGSLAFPGLYFYNNGCNQHHFVYRISRYISVVSQPHIEIPRPQACCVDAMVHTVTLHSRTLWEKTCH